MVSSTFHGFKEQLLQHENTSEMKELVEHIHGVISIEELHALEHGHFLIVEMKICVNPTITVLEGQTIANTIKAQLMKKFTHITDVSVQVMPYDSGYPYKNTLDLNHNDYPTVLH
jgi:divalent metal cation (Fe/Co/Zn/Cd) transporter